MAKNPKDWEITLGEVLLHSYVYRVVRACEYIDDNCLDAWIEAFDDLYDEIRDRPPQDDNATHGS